MKKNIDTQGRIVRFVAACLLLAYSFWQGSWVAFAIALFVFYEALASWCFVNWLLGRSSCPIERDK